MLRSLLPGLLLLLPSVAWATIDPKCTAAIASPPADYNIIRQQDFVANYIALSLSNSPIHAPIPDAPGHGHIGVQLGVIPPLSCMQRYMLYAGVGPDGKTPTQTGKTEDTNKAPAAPKLTVGFTFPLVGGWAFYGSMEYLPPVPLLGVRNVVLGGEFGVGRKLGDHWSAGVRMNVETIKTVGDIATAFFATDPSIVDLYVASTMGFDAQLGYHAGPVRPYVMAGILDVSTFFYVGDDGVISNNMHPYLGPEFAVGLDNEPVLPKANKHADKHPLAPIRWGVEFYGAPGGHSTPANAFPGTGGVDPDSANASFARYGHVYTLRGQIGVDI